MSARERIETRRAQRPGEPDERKPDECGRIPRVHSLEQGNTEAFAAKTARAIERPVEFDVAGNLLRREGAEVDGREIHMLGDGARLDAVEYGRRVEFDALTAARSELLAAARCVARFVEDAPSAHGHLV